VTEDVLEFRPPTSARTEVVSEGNDDSVGGDVRSGGDASFGVTNGVGEFLEGVLLEVVVVAALLEKKKRKKLVSFSTTTRKGSQTHLEVRHDHEVGFVDGDGLVAERLDEVMVSHERQRRLVDVIAHRTLHVVVNRLGQTDDMALR